MRTTASSTKPSNNKQDKFNLALNQYFKNIKGTKIPRNKTHNRGNLKTNMRQTSDQGALLNNLFTFVVQ